MKGFLESVAEGYHSRYSTDLSRLVFVMPNKRSGSFLLRDLSRLCTSPLVGPRVITISDLVAEISALVPASRLAALFLLFDCYRKMKGDDAADFEEFMSWGEAVMSDFNEIDMQMVDADEIFKNLKDFKDIRTDYLTEEQRRVIERYFRYRVSENDDRADSFWVKYAESEEDEGEEASTEVKRKYRSLWQMLNPLYKKFKKELADKGLMSSGGAYRTAAEKLEEGFDPFPGDKLVFVGFNALTESERRIFKSLKKREVELNGDTEPKADFVWDPVSRLLAGEDDPAVRFVALNMESDMFPSPQWLDEFLEESRPDKAPDFEVVSVPSNVLQVKLISNRLKSLREKISEENIQNARVAVVLPDENLLLPLLYSLPEGYKNPNLTMGFPLKHTPPVSFVALLRRLQARMRKRKDGTCEFYYGDVKDVLAHPYSHLIFGQGKIADFLKEQNQAKRINVPMDDVVEGLGEPADKIFRAVSDDQPRAVLVYISDILLHIRSRLLEKNTTYLRSKVETAFINTYLNALQILDSGISEYDTKMKALTVMRLAERIVAGESVPFEGEPLQGLQVMGLLETRALDFDYVLMPSMNDKVMPRRGGGNTFIPSLLRIAYGLPPANYQEDLFAYYFFRLAGRCKKMVLTYDARSNDNRNGGISRFIFQLLHLTDPEKVKIERVEARFDPDEGREAIQSREEKKVPEIMERVNRYFDKSADQKNISASALKNFGQCPLRFLYQNVMEIPVEEEEMETISAADNGTIIHEIMENLYLKHVGKPEESHIVLNPPKRITPDDLKQLLVKKTPDGESVIVAETKRAINHVHFKINENPEAYPVTGSAAELVDQIVSLVEGIIRFDMEAGGLVLHGCEIKETIAYPVTGYDRPINFKMVIDRLDEVDGFLRIVDYKTGSTHLVAQDLMEVFEASSSSYQILQLALYARLLERMAMEDVKNEKGTRKRVEISGFEPSEIAEKLKMHVYHIPSINKKTKQDRKNGIVSPKIGDIKIETLSQLKEIETDEDEPRNFDAMLDAMLDEILNPEIPFVSRPSERTCRYCDYKLRCETVAHVKKK